MQKKPVLVLIEGCYDVFHFGHLNAIRQARSFGSHLVVGINDEETTKAHKNTLLTTSEERLEIISGLKWVDSIIYDAPYILDYQLMREFNIDIITHGDDLILTEDGRDVYEEARLDGRFKTFKRTFGISTTDIVGRLLMHTRNFERYTLDSINYLKSLEKKFCEPYIDNLGGKFARIPVYSCADAGKINVLEAIYKTKIEATILQNRYNFSKISLGKSAYKMVSISPFTPRCKCLLMNDASRGLTDDPNEGINSENEMSDMSIKKGSKHYNDANCCCKALYQTNNKFNEIKHDEQKKHHHKTSLLSNEHFKESNIENYQLCRQKESMKLKNFHEKLKLDNNEGLYQQVSMQTNDFSECISKNHFDLIIHPDSRRIACSAKSNREKVLSSLYIDTEPHIIEQQSENKIFQSKELHTGRMEKVDENIDPNLLPDYKKNNCTLKRKKHQSPFKTKQPTIYTSQDGVVYMSDTFDLYHAGHAAHIRNASMKGQKLLVGLFSDSSALKNTGREPVLSFMERKLILLGNKFIDQIVTDPPYYLTEEFIEHNKISKIACTSKTKHQYLNVAHVVEIIEITTKFDYLNTDTIVQRILENYREYARKVEKSLYKNH